MHMLLFRPREKRIGKKNTYIKEESIINPASSAVYTLIDNIKSPQLKFVTSNSLASPLVKFYYPTNTTTRPLINLLHTTIDIHLFVF